MSSSNVAAGRPVEQATPVRVEQLLLRYPRLSDSEISEIAVFLRDATLMQIGLLSTHQKAWKNAEIIRSKYPQLFKSTGKQKLFAAFAFSTLAVVPLLLWAMAP